MIEGARIAVWFSCGAASAVAAKLTVDRYGATNDVRIVNNPVAEEDPDNRRFLADVAAWIGRPIEEAINPKWPSCSAVEVWAKKQFMASPLGAPCTSELKKEARYAWEAANAPDWHVLGFTADPRERRRHANFVLTERENVLPVLIDARITKVDCFGILARAGIEVPRIYRQGYPNANCKGCVKASAPDYWNLVRRVDPDVFAARAQQSREIGAKLVKVKGERIYLDELADTPSTGDLSGLDFECGIFCEEPTP